MQRRQARKSNMCGSERDWENDWNDAPAYRGQRVLSPGSGWFEGLRAHALGMGKMEEVQAEVQAEQRGRVALVSRDPKLNGELLAQIRAQPLVGEEPRLVQREGVFVLVNLSAGAPNLSISSVNSAAVYDMNACAWAKSNSEYSHDEFDSYESGEARLFEQHQANLALQDSLQHSLQDALAEVDCILYVWRADAGWHALDTQWYSRLRATALPAAIVAICPPHFDEAAVESVRREHAVRPVFITLNASDAPEATPPAHLLALLDRLLALSPRLALVLAQESPLWRAVVVRRVVRTGSLMAALLGAEPVPLLDLPLQLAMQWKVALQISTIYGRPTLDLRSREMLAALALNLLVRAGAQQLLKLMPLVGWILSAALSASSTWLLGTTLARYYEEEQLLDLSAIKRLRWRKPISPHQEAVNPYESVQSGPAEVQDIFVTDEKNAGDEE